LEIKNDFKEFTGEERNKCCADLPAFGRREIMSEESEYSGYILFE
jgi:hypothetical protein